MTQNRMLDGDVKANVLERFIKVQTHVIVFCITMQCFATIGTGMWVSSKLRTTPHEVIQKIERIGNDLPAKFDALTHRLDGDGNSDYPKRLQVLLDAIEKNHEQLERIATEVDELQLTLDSP